MCICQKDMFIAEDGTERLVFRLKKKEKGGYHVKSKEGSIVMSFSAHLEPELKTAFGVLLGECSGSERYKSSHADEKTASSSSGHGNGEEAPVSKDGMPLIEVFNILTSDPCIVKPCDVESLCRLVQEEGVQVPDEILRFVAEQYSEEMREKITVFENWVRDEFEEKGYVEVPDQFISDREDARKQSEEHFDQYLPDSYFTTVIGEDGKEKLVFSFTGKEKVVSESKSKEGNIFRTYSSEVMAGMKAARRNRAKSSHADRGNARRLRQQGRG